MAQDSERLIGEAPAFMQVLESVSQIAPLEKPVLVVGERGTGKELIAARLHYLSNRWEAEYQKVNCAAISESLLESELFGHEAGSFTGASKAHQGRFERADKGTLFLDELATTSMRVQEKLLRVIEYGEFERLGGQKTKRVDVRLVAATNVDLPALADRGDFRHDLLDRLAFDVITLPPLRARQEDIVLLANHFAINMASELDRDFFPGFTDDAIDTLNNHSWPGNIRELKNAVERSVYRTAEDEPVAAITLDAFASPYRPSTTKPATIPAPSSPAPSSKPTEQPDEETPAAPATSSGGTFSLPLDLRDELKRHEIALIEQGMEEARFNQRKAAELLGLTYHQLRGLLKKYDLLNAANQEETD